MASGYMTVQFDFGEYAGELRGPNIKLWKGMGMPVFEGTIADCAEAYPEAVALLLQHGYIKMTKE